MKTCQPLCKICYFMLLLRELQQISSYTWREFDMIALEMHQKHVKCNCSGFVQNLSKCITAKLLSSNSCADSENNVHDCKGQWQMECFRLLQLFFIFSQNQSFCILMALQLFVYPTNILSLELCKSSSSFFLRFW